MFVTILSKKIEILLLNGKKIVVLYLRILNLFFRRQVSISLVFKNLWGPSL